MKTFDQPLLFAIEEFIYSPAASPASPLVRQGEKTARRMTATSGRKCFALLPKRGLLTSLAKTLLTSSEWQMVSTAYSLTWQVKATKRYRLAFQLAVSERGTGASAGLSLLPTPKAAYGGPDYAKLKRSSTGLNLVTQLHLQPHADEIRRERHTTAGKRESSLRNEMNELMPTPVSSSGGNPGLGNSLTLNDKLNGRTHPSDPIIGQRGSINPWWEEIYMGLPPGWTYLPDETAAEP